MMLQRGAAGEAERRPALARPAIGRPAGLGALGLSTDDRATLGLWAAGASGSICSGLGCRVDVPQGGTGSLTYDAAAEKTAIGQFAAAIPDTPASMYRTWVEAFAFTATVPSGEQRYGIELGHDQGTVWFTQAEMRKGPCCPSARWANGTRPSRNHTGQLTFPT
jgi:hypothetical protein